MIKDLIKSELEILKKIDEVLDRESEVLKNDQSSLLYSIVDEKKKLALELSRIEKKRKQICGDKTSKDLLKENSIDENLINEIEKVTLSIKLKNELNMLLTKQTLSYIKMYKDILSYDQKVITYKYTGKLNETTNSTFNTKI